MDKIVRNLLIGLGVMIVLVPLGLLATGETFGEWANEELQEKLGFVPHGLEQLASLWSAPIPEYAFPEDEPKTGKVAAYYISAIVGAIICAGLLYFIGKRVAKA
ncbi:MAG: PDGLE domain-containing protein [Methanotrichaceae archaeon]|nr:PDGLE domain-containing protein [Methanotrichaceae archaeon]